MKYVCAECGSDEIEQQAIVWVPMNDPDAPPSDWINEKNYFCPECGLECIPKEIEDESKLKIELN